MIDLSAGQLVADKYRVDHVIGAGGMGVVLAATHLDLDQPVAIKVLKDANDEAIARFQREARLIVRFKSVHVARVFDVGALDDDTPYFVMERLEGEDLSKVLARRGTLPVEQAVDYVLEACEAVAEAHTLGVVHRDLKPANLFVARGPGGRGSVKVLDFGVSKRLTEGSQVGHLTNEGVALGSPGYMAPEQIESSRDVDARADIYSLGAILYRLTSGKNPYKGETVMSVLASMVATPLAPLTSVADVPAEFARIVEQCLAKEPGQRPPSVADLAKELARFGSRRAQASLEQILATMGVDDVGQETLSLSPEAAAKIPGFDPDGADTTTTKKTKTSGQGADATTTMVSARDPSALDDTDATTAMTPRPMTPPVVDPLPMLSSSPMPIGMPSSPMPIGAPPSSPMPIGTPPSADPAPWSAAPSGMAPVVRRVTPSASASLLPLALAMMFLAAIVGWVALRRSRAPAVYAAPSEVPTYVAPEPVTTEIATPAPEPVLPASPAPEPTTIELPANEPSGVSPRPKSRPHARPTPSPTPAPVAAPKKPNDAPPSLNDIPGGRH